MKMYHSGVTESFPCLCCVSIFKDLLNFDDPLNIEAAEHHLRDKVGWGQEVLAGVFGKEITMSLD